MDNRTELNYSRYFLYLTSLLSVLVVLRVISNAVDNILFEGAARDFVTLVNKSPPSVRRLSTASMICLVAMILLSLLIGWFYVKNAGKTLLPLFVFTEIILALVINYYLCCAYRNALYIVFSNIIVYITNKRYRLLFIVLTLCCYIAVEYNSIANLLIPYQFDTFIPYLNTLGNNWMTVKTVIFALNDLSFIYFCIVAVSNKEREKEKINALNETLSRTNSELMVTNVQLQDQVKHTEELAIYKERTRFSREMHDIIGHVLTGIVIGVEACQTLVTSDPKRLLGQLDSILALAKKGLQDIRATINGLRSQEDTMGSLLTSIQRLVDDITACTQMSIRLEIQGGAAQLGSIKENIVYRIIQESITNAVKHAHAREMRIELCFTREALEVNVSNDGTVPPEIVEGFGITSIRERVASIGGRLEIRLTENTRFRLVVTLPYDQVKEYD